MSLHVIDELTQTLSNLESSNKSLKIANYIWDVNSLSWIKQSASAGTSSTEVVVTNFPATYPISDNGGSITIDGSVSVIGFENSTESSTTNISLTTSESILLPANSNRKGATIFNNSTTAIAYLNFGTTVSTTDFIIAMPPNSYYEVPFKYTGRIMIIASSATGFVTVSELT